MPLDELLALILCADERTLLRSPLVADLSLYCVSLGMGGRLVNEERRVRAAVVLPT